MEIVAYTLITLACLTVGIWGLTVDRDFVAGINLVLAGANLVVTLYKLTSL